MLPNQIAAPIPLFTEKAVKLFNIFYLTNLKFKYFQLLIRRLFVHNPFPTAEAPSTIYFDN